MSRQWRWLCQPSNGISVKYINLSFSRTPVQKLAWSICLLFLSALPTQNGHAIGHWSIPDARQSPNSRATSRWTRCRTNSPSEGGLEKNSGIRISSKGFRTRIQLMQQTGQPRALLALLVLPSALVDQGIGEPTASTLCLLISPPQITKLQSLYKL